MDNLRAENVLHRSNLASDPENGLFIKRNLHQCHLLVFCWNLVYKLLSSQNGYRARVTNIRNVKRPPNGHMAQHLSR